MSWSLQLHGGDLALSGTSLATVTDEQKLVQDLRCALLTPMGSDEIHPDYGSLIDGGRTPDGTVVPGVVGMGSQQAATTVQAEIQRIATTYQSQQLARAKSDQVTYNRVSLTSAEVLLGITNIQMTQSGDVFNVVVALQTARGESLTLALPILTTT